jgi:transcriptional regulator with XRE-family HTH domain
MEMARQFDVAKMRDDMAEKGWLPTDLAKESGLSDMTVSRFLKGERQNPRTAKKLAEALGRTTRRYLIRSEGSAEQVAS